VQQQQQQQLQQPQQQQSIIESVAIFNSNLNTTNSEEVEDVQKELIYYYPQNVPVVEQIKEIGLAKAIISFTNTFQLKDTNNTIHSKNFRQILIQPEKDFWISMKINIDKFIQQQRNTQDNIEYVNKQLNDTYLESKLNMLYLKFRIFNNSFSNILKDESVEKLRKKTKVYFDFCIPNLKFDSIDLLSTITGLNMISLTRDIELEIEDFMDKVHKNYQFTSGSLLFWKNNVIYNDMDFDYLKDMTVLYDYLIDPSITDFPSLKIHALQKNKPIINTTPTNSSANTAPISTQNKSTLLQSIKYFNIFSGKGEYQNTGFLTGPLSINNYLYYTTVGKNSYNYGYGYGYGYGRSSHSRSRGYGHRRHASSSTAPSSYTGGNNGSSSKKESSTASRFLFPNVGSYNSTHSDVPVSKNPLSESHLKTSSSTSNLVLLMDSLDVMNGRMGERGEKEAKRRGGGKGEKREGAGGAGEGEGEEEGGEGEDKGDRTLPQIIYLGDQCDPYYLIIYKYLEEITAIFFIKVNTNQEFEETYISFSKLSKSKDTITSFDNIPVSPEDYGGYVEQKLKSDEYYYSFEATIRSDLDTLLHHMEPLMESQTNIIDEQYKYIVFKHSKMLVKTSKGYLKQSPLNQKLYSQYLLDLYDDLEKKQDCTELCVRSDASIWMAIKRIDQCDYILILPRYGFKQLAEIDDEFKKVMASFQQQQQQHDSIMTLQ